MPNYIRSRQCGGTYFFTACLAKRGSQLLVAQLNALRFAVAKAKLRRPFEIDAMVILPDHIHAVWTLPPGDSDYSTRWAAIKSDFSRSCRRAGFIPPPPTGFDNGGVNPALRRKGEIGLWQPRFWEHTIRSETDYWHHVRYCWWNPVKHGLVTRPQDWEFSSVHKDPRFKPNMTLTA